MAETVPVTHEFLETLAALRLPPRLDERLQNLMDRHNDGALDATERDELAAFVELSETLGIARGGALHALGRMPA